jgi:hypothetical protein
MGSVLPEAGPSHARLAFFLVLLGVLAGATARPIERAGGYKPIPLPGTDVLLMPESERTMERLVLGLDVNRTKFFMLPETTPWDPRSSDPNVRYLRRQLYWLNFELLHGGLLKAAPEYTRFFVAVPEPDTPDSLGNEEEVFREYLRERVGWTPETIARRVAFFRTPSSLPFPRDMAEPLGRDSRHRLVLGLGEDTDAFYAEPVHRLVRAFPNDFVVMILTRVNTEGGDMSLVWLPGGGIGLLLGYHRILRYAEATGRAGRDEEPVPAPLVEEGRAAFGRAFYGVEVLVLGEESLRDRDLASAELFHADMVASVLLGRNGVVAFVPSFVKQEAVDSILREPVPEEVRRRAQGEYDRAARQLRRRGYRVVRLPLSDHPDRTPVQVGGFVDLRNGRQSLLIGKYPYQFSLPDGRNPQADLQAALGRLEEAVLAWRTAPTAMKWGEVKRRIAGVWAEMDRAAERPNPAFDAQRRIYEAEGIRVVPVPIYATGEGGLHCLLLN